MKWIVDKKVLIVGLGIIGGSYAKGLKKLGYTIYAIDKNQDAINYAIENDIIDYGYTEVEKEVLKDIDNIIFGMYPHVFVKWIEKYHSFIKKGILVTDVTGVKACIVDKIQDILFQDGIEYIPAHPMAGKEVYGVENSDETIFHGANYIVTPTKRNTPEAIEWCKSLGRILGFKMVAVITPDEHDQMIAFLSQMTHVIAMALMTGKDNQDLVDFTGDSFRDLTRIAKINENMWPELFFSNKENLIKEMNDFIEEFTILKNIIEDEDLEALKNKMILSTKRRSYFDKKRK